jgi:hypothetical protein
VPRLNLINSIYKMIVCCKYNMPNNILLSTKITSLVVAEWKAKRSLQTLFDLPACIKHNHSPQKFMSNF